MKIQKKLINDTIYNHIEYSEVEGLIFQTKTFNRLQFITQNALAYFSFPSISTKRLIHSIGTMHISSYMLKSALVNCEENLKDEFLKDARKVIKSIIKEHNLKLKLCDKTFDTSSLYQFSVPVSSKPLQCTYDIVLQALRVAALLHDLGHLPFSHQSEKALENVYEKLLEKENYTQKEKNFITIYKKLCVKKNRVLHEAIGENLLSTLFENELFDLMDKSALKDFLKLIYELVRKILGNKKDKKFDFSFLYKIISSTVDADRLDYINRDMLSSGYISGANDNIRVTKYSILVKENNSYDLSFLDSGLIDIEHILEMRFNLYKKVISNHSIAKTDWALEFVISYICEKYFINNMYYDEYSFDCIGILWTFLNEKNRDKKLDIVSMLDENWLISLFKKEYFVIKAKKSLSFEDMKFLKALEEVLFGKEFFKSHWKNLNEFYKVLEFSKIQRYKYRESFGFVGNKSFKKLKLLLDRFCEKHGSKKNYFSYHIVSIKIGIDKDFTLYDGFNTIKIDEVSTIRKRLKKSILNTVPFYLYSNLKYLNEEMIKDLENILVEVF